MEKRQNHQKEPPWLCMGLAPSHEAGVDQGIELPPSGVAHPGKKHRITASKTINK
ncbi:MAG: hypothetical protein PHO00_04055 [bacterium]|nr:hypothetical protein [bacterium]